MTEEDRIRRRITALFQTNPVVHVDVSVDRPKMTVLNQEARIRGVYPYIFRLESNGKCYTLQYADVLMKKIRIAEIENGTAPREGQQ